MVTSHRDGDVTTKGDQKMKHKVTPTNSLFFIIIGIVTAVCRNG